MVIQMHKEILKDAVGLGWDLNSCNEYNQNLLACICKNDLVYKLYFLIEIGLKLKSDNEIGQFLWRTALQNGALADLELMKSLGFDSKSKEAIIYAIKAENFRSLKWLIENKADLNKMIEDGYPIHYACETRNLKIVKLLLNTGASLESKDELGYSPFHRAIIKIVNNINFLKALLDLGADIDSVNNDGSTPLYHALKKRKLLEIDFLLENGASLDHPKIKQSKLRLCTLYC